jgi:hypothetical protein
MSHFLRLSTVLLIGCLLTGCGQDRVKARGRLLKSGQPFVPSEKEIVHVALFPAGEGSDASARSYVAMFNRQDGTFKVTGADGKGLPPGKYRVAVSLMKEHKDELKGAFNVQNSPVVCEVSSASSEITVDLATPSKPAAQGAPATQTKRRSNK